MKVREWQSDDYHGFWDSASRRYLDRVERIVLNRFVKRGQLVIDVGGGYGRLMDVYRERFTRAVVVDHSLSMLQDAAKRLRSEGIPNVMLVAANVYDLPFVDGVADQVFMIRILHHLAEPPRAIASVNRILRPGGSFALEYQNVRNINNRIKKRLGRPTCDLDTLVPVPQDEEMYWNFHPDYIRSCLEPDFEIQRVLGGGLLWERNVLVRLLVYPELVDRLFGGLFGRHAITHQIFLDLLSTQPAPAERQPVAVDDPLRILRCTHCPDSSLADGSSCVVCQSCGTVYPIHGRVYDFR